VLREHLENHWLRGGTGSLVFGEDGKPFRGDTPTIRAKPAWTAAGLEPITLHECRHAAASFAIAAGVNAKTLSTYMGHANIAITFDLYGHLMPGNEGEAAVLLDAYLAS
jgi:integrase